MIVAKESARKEQLRISISPVEETTGSEDKTNITVTQPDTTRSNVHVASEPTSPDSSSALSANVASTGMMMDGSSIPMLDLVSAGAGNIASDALSLPGTPDHSASDVSSNEISPRSAASAGAGPLSARSNASYDGGLEPMSPPINMHISGTGDEVGVSPRRRKKAAGKPKKKKSKNRKKDKSNQKPTA